MIRRWPVLISACTLIPGWTLSHSAWRAGSPDAHDIGIFNSGPLSRAQFKDAGKPAQDLGHGKTHKENERFEEKIETLHSC